MSNVNNDEPGKTFKISENLIIGVDISYNEDVSILIVARQLRGPSLGSLEGVNSFFGVEAEELYEKLINKKIKEVAD